MRSDAVVGKRAGKLRAGLPLSREHFTQAAGFEQCISTLAQVIESPATINRSVVRQFGEALHQQTQCSLRWLSRRPRFTQIACTSLPSPGCAARMQ